jgi:hypothetical protein
MVRQVGGAEYTFSQAGIFFHLPKRATAAPGQTLELKESISLGFHWGTANEVHEAISR